MIALKASADDGHKSFNDDSGWGCGMHIVRDSFSVSLWRARQAQGGGGRFQRKMSPARSNGLATRFRPGVRRETRHGERCGGWSLAQKRRGLRRDCQGSRHPDRISR